MSKIVCRVLVFCTNDFGILVSLHDEHHKYLVVFVENVQWAIRYAIIKLVKIKNANVEIHDIMKRCEII